MAGQVFVSGSSGSIARFIIHQSVGEGHAGMAFLPFFAWQSLLERERVSGCCFRGEMSCPPT